MSKSVVRRAVSLLVDTIARPGRGTKPAPVFLASGVVTAVTASAALAHYTDVSPSVAAVTVDINGESVTASYLDSYTSPAAGDFVRVALCGGTVQILGRPTGFPIF